MATASTVAAGSRSGRRQATKHEELSGVFGRVIWEKPEEHFLIAVLESGETVKGVADREELVPGLPYRFYGRWTPATGRFGPAFQFVCAVKDTPHSRGAVVKYLAQLLGKAAVGIGPKTASRLYDLYEGDAIRKLRMSPADVARDLKLDVDKCRAAAQILESESKNESVKVEVIDLLNGHGFPRSTVREVIDKWGARAPGIIRRDAFQLMTGRVRGAGFLRCDRLYLDLGGDPVRLKRQMLAAWYSIKTDGAGHTWHPVSTGIEAIRSKVGSVDIRPVKAIKLGIRARWLAVERPGEERWITEANQATSEKDIARLVTRLAGAEPKWPVIEQGDLTPHQADQLAAACRGRLAILCGTPGTGKTWTAARLIRAIIAEHGPGAIKVCAPTGKAAVRITATMQKYGHELEGIQAQTIHRMLIPNELGYGTANWCFQHGESNPLPCDWVIVDEASMIDADLMAALLRACSPSTHILLIGDPYQLPPVGHGAPLRDLLAAGVPSGELTEIKRNDGLIVRACQSIKHGRPFSTCGRFDSGTGANLRVVPAASVVGIFETLRAIYGAVVEAGRRDPFDEVQVLCPLNEKSAIGRTAINKFLQPIVNKSGSIVEANRFREGDKIICLSNDRYPGELADKIPVMNGEMGRVTAATVEHTHMVFPDVGDGDRLLKISRKAGFDDSFDLAYAITTHKSQGSEWPVVIVVADDAADRIASREWWYTAISRASDRCIILGSPSTIGRQCRKVTLRDRKTFLEERIKGGAKDGHLARA
jgi:exodeoxyribonuclease V alpha subunit